MTSLNDGLLPGSVRQIISFLPNCIWSWSYHSNSNQIRFWMLCLSAINRTLYSETHSLKKSKYLCTTHGNTTFITFGWICLQLWRECLMREDHGCKMWLKSCPLISVHVPWHFVFISVLLHFTSSLPISCLCSIKSCLTFKTLLALVCRLPI